MPRREEKGENGSVLLIKEGGEGGKWICKNLPLTDDLPRPSKEGGEGGSWIWI